MNQSEPRARSTSKPQGDSLQSLVQSCNANFGEILLADHDAHTSFVFEDFVSVAECVVETQPRLAALHLASLLALDVQRQTDGGPVDDAAEAPGDRSPGADDAQRRSR